jgi:hypothetical protein
MMAALVFAVLAISMLAGSMLSLVYYEPRRQ